MSGAAAPRARAFALLNPAAGGGRAVRRLATLRAELERRCDLEVAVLDRSGRWTDELARAVRRGATMAIAAGGDGTVGALAGEVAAMRERGEARKLVLGALGLGSSNDFHKPFGARIHGVPTRIDLARATPRDLGRAVYRDGAGTEHARIFVVSASLGVAARANDLFNQPDRVLRALKRCCVPAAILWAGANTIARHHDVEAGLDLGDGMRRVRLANLSVAKTRYLSGAFHYDTPAAPSDGLLAVNLRTGCTRAALIATLLALARGRFSGRPGCLHQAVPRLRIALDAAEPLELDGEVVSAREVAFDVLPWRIDVCA